MERFDAVVLGGGLLGCFAARNLVRRRMRVALVEGREDVCTGISRANTAIVYTGCDTKPGTLKTRLCVEANRTFDALCGELGVPFRRCGSVMVSYGPRADRVLARKLEQGRENGVEGLELLPGPAAEAMEPGLASGVSSALYAPGTGTVEPWTLGIAAFENARDNGCVPLLSAPVTAIRREREGYLVTTDRGALFARAVVNCCGLAADQVQELIAPPLVRIVPDRADYLVLDDTVGTYVNHIVFHEPEEKGKGLTLVPTVDGRLLLGPTERPEDGSEPWATSEDGLDWLRKRAGELVPRLDLNQTIRSFGALRPNPFYVHQEGENWVPEERSISNFTLQSPAPNFWSLIGIKTPGLTCADGLGRYVAQRVWEGLGITEDNPAFDPVRLPPVRVADRSPEERNALIAARPDYGTVLCRCGGVTEGEVADAVRRGAVTLDGVKRRAGAGLGRCQGSFCADRVMEVLARELGRPVTELTKDGPGTTLLTGMKWPTGEEGMPPAAERNRPLIHSGRDVALLVVGGGAAGMAAAVAAEQAGVRPILLVDRADRLGGVLPQCIHHGFGLGRFREDLTGPEYAAREIARLEKTNIEVRRNTAALEIGADRTALLSSTQGCERVRFRRVVLATGCRETPVGALPVAGPRPAGVWTAGQAQRMVNLLGWELGREIVILGSGDIGLIMARRLTLKGCRVTVVEQREKCGGMERNYRSCILTHHIPLMTRCTVTRVHGQGHITGVTVRHLDTGREESLPCDALITAVGLVPERELLRPLGEPLPDWVSLCGNCDYVHEIVDTVTAQGEALGRKLGE